MAYSSQDIARKPSRLCEERFRHHWSQRDLAEKLGTTRLTISRWENGTSSPSPYFRHQLCELFGKSAQELGLIPKDVEESHTNLDHASVVRRHIATFSDKKVNQKTFLSTSDHEEIAATPNLYGREAELALLARWITINRCQLIMILGSSGIGKTTLAIALAQHIRSSFSCFIWYSLRDAPAMEDMLQESIHSILAQLHIDLPTFQQPTLSYLLHLLHEYRCLFLLDNVEAILHETKREFDPGYEEYALFFEQIAIVPHQSSVICTCREKFTLLETVEARNVPVRSLKLAGLEQSACQKLLEDMHLSGKQVFWEKFVQLYAGNPLVLKIVSAMIRDLFDGDIALFLDMQQK